MGWCRTQLCNYVLRFARFIISGSRTGLNCVLSLWTKQEYWVLGPLRVTGTVLESAPTERLQDPHGQWQAGNDQEEQPPWSGPPWYFVDGRLWQSQFVHKEPIVWVWGCASVQVTPRQPGGEISVRLCGCCLAVVGLSWVTGLCNIAVRDSGSELAVWNDGPFFRNRDWRLYSNYRGITGLLCLPKCLHLKNRILPIDVLLLEEEQLDQTTLWPLWWRWTFLSKQSGML